MFLARLESNQGTIIGIGLRPQDLHRLVREGRPASFSLAEAGEQGPDATERVLLAFARPEQMEQMRHGYFPGITDARVVLFIDHRTLHELQAGRPLSIQTPGAPVSRFVIFTADTDAVGRAETERAMRAAGLPVRISENTPRRRPTPLAFADGSTEWGAAHGVASN